MTIFRFPVELTWPGGKRMLAQAPGTPELQIATPPVLRGEIEGSWSPEDTLAAAVAGCYGVTLIALCERARVPLLELRLQAEALVGREGKEPFGVKAIELQAELRGEPDRDDELRQLAEHAEEACLVSAALRVPVRLTVTVSG